MICLYGCSIESENKKTGEMDHIIWNSVLMNKKTMMKLGQITRLDHTDLK